VASMDVEMTREDFATLYDRHAPGLFGFCARRVGPDVAEDVVANTFLTAYEYRHRYDGARGDALPWLYGIATNLLRRHRREEVRSYRLLARTGVDPLSGADAAAGHEQRSDERTDARARARRIAGALSALPTRQRDVLLLYAVGELEYSEIAAALNIPLGSVQSALHRARAKLRAALTESEYLTWETT
jgi:RNA polymerase sigma factor (sigma-70 family)